MIPTNLRKLLQSGVIPVNYPNWRYLAPFTGEGYKHSPIELSLPQITYFCYCITIRSDGANAIFDCVLRFDNAQVLSGHRCIHFYTYIDVNTILAGKKRTANHVIRSVCDFFRRILDAFIIVLNEAWTQCLPKVFMETFIERLIPWTHSSYYTLQRVPSGCFRPCGIKKPLK